MTNIEFIRKQWMNINAMIHEEGRAILDHNHDIVTDVGVDECGFYYATASGKDNRKYMAFHDHVTSADHVTWILDNWMIAESIRPYEKV